MLIDGIFLSDTVNLVNSCGEEDIVEMVVDILEHVFEPS